MTTKLIKISAVLVAAAMATGCASDKAREFDAANFAAANEARDAAQLKAIVGTLDAMDAARQIVHVPDSGGKVITIDLPGPFTPFVAPSVSTLPSEVQAQIDAQKNIAIGLGPYAFEAYNAKQERKKDFAIEKLRARSRDLQTRTNLAISKNNNELLAQIAAGAASPVVGDFGGGSLSGYPCAIRSGVLESDFVSGSISDGIDEDGSSGLPCVDYAEPEPEPEPEPEV